MIQKTFRQLLLTQILSALTVTQCMLIDSIMIGRFLGVDSMTAYGLASPVLLVFAAAGSMISAGVQVVCGKAMGGGDREGANACLTASAALGLGVSLLGLVLVLTLTGPLCTLLGAGAPAPDNAVFQLTRDYLRGFILGAPAFICSQIMVPYMQIAGRQTRLVVAVLTMTVADLLFDLLNVLVFHGGTFGMGIASSLSYYCAFAIGAAAFLQRDFVFRFHWRGLKRGTFAALLQAGVPTLINQVCLVLLIFLLNKILLSVGGNLAVAAYSVLSTVGNICYSFGTGIGSVSLTLSAVYYSDEDRTALLALVRTLALYSLLLDTAVTLAVLLCAPVLVTLFLEHPGARDMAVLGVRLFALSLVPSALNTGLKNYYQGVGRLGLTKLISVLQNFLLITLTAFLLSRVLGTTGVWLGYVCGEALTLLLVSLTVWRAQGRIRVDAPTYALLPEDFGAPPEDCLELSVHSLEEAVEASRQAADFCRKRWPARRATYFIPLCIEEMAVNTVTYGFGRDKRAHQLDIRLVLRDGRGVIRFRDDCAGFDPTAYLKLHQADDPTAHIGLRMVMRMVHDATYVNSLGLNNLTLTL